MSRFEIEIIMLRRDIIKCNASIKRFDMERARRYFERAWARYAAGYYSDTEEEQLFWLRNNFVDNVAHAWTFSERGYYVEGLILARAEF